MRDKSYTSNCPVLPHIDKNGGMVDGTVYKPVMCLEEPGIKAVIELKNVAVNQYVLALDVNATVTNCHVQPSVNVMPLSLQI